MTLTTPMTTGRQDGRDGRVGRSDGVATTAASVTGGHDQGHGLSPGGGVPQLAPDGRGNGPRPWFTDPAHRHTQMFALDDDDDTGNPKVGFEGLGDLGRQPFLHLRTPRVEVDKPVTLQSGPGMYPTWADPWKGTR